MLNSKVIAAVQALAFHGSFGDAAASIGVSPASFSRYIAQAEAYAGLALFERRHNGASLTPGGHAFVKLLDELEGAQAQFATAVERLRDPAEFLQIGCGPLTTRTIIAPLLSGLMNERPDLRARVVVRAHKEPLELLRAGKLDVAVCDLTHTPDLSDLDIQVVRREPVSFWARPAHPVFKKTDLTVGDVLRLPFGTAYLHRHWRGAIVRALGGDEEALRIVERSPQVECDDFAFLSDLACQSDLVLAGRTDTFAEHAALGLLKEIRTSDAMHWNICAARRKDRVFDALDAFWARLVKTYGADASEPATVTGSA